MQYLLDTHILIWLLFDSKQLPSKVREVVLNPEDKIYYSTASLWEIDIKHNKHPKDFQFTAKEVADLCLDANIENLPIFNKHIYQLSELKKGNKTPKHKDPFDLILLAQAKRSDMKLLSHDHLFEYYNENCICKI